MSTQEDSVPSASAACSATSRGVSSKPATPRGGGSPRPPAEPLLLAMQSWRSARIHRARRKAQRRRTLALVVPVLAFFVALFGKGFLGSGLQRVAEIAAEVLSAVRNGEIAEAAWTVQEALRNIAYSPSVRKLLLPLFLTVVLRMARDRVVQSINGTSVDTAAVARTTSASQTKEAETAANFEWPRRMQHIISGLVVVAMYLFLPFAWALAFVSIAIAFLYCVGWLRRHSARFNVVYVDLLKNIIRPREKDPSCHPSAFPFLWGCLVVLLLSTRSLATVCVLLLTLGDPAAGVFREQCRMWSSVGHDTTLLKASAKVLETRDAQKAATPREDLGCCCNSKSSPRSKRCFWGFLSCWLVCAVAVMILALLFAFISRPHGGLSEAPSQSQAAISRFENPLLRYVLSGEEAAYSWPSILQPLDHKAATGEAAAAETASVGERLLTGELQSWGFLAILALAVGSVAAAAEAVTIKGVDDNLSMPIICMVCFGTVFGIYVQIKGLTNAAVGPREISALSSFDCLMLLMFSL